MKSDAFNAFSSRVGATAFRPSLKISSSGLWCEAVFNDLDVLSVEPPVFEHLGGFLGILVIAHHDVRPLDQNLTVVGDFHVDAVRELARCQSSACFRRWWCSH